ncbi:HtrA family protein [Ahrensia sp. R2A130]|nr:HtrA family protein [Ahrensia sp. R2A130]
MRLTRFAAALAVLFATPIAAAYAQTAVPQTREQVTYSYAPLVKQIAPAVVNVYAAREVPQRRSPFAGDPFFERFFGREFSGKPQRRQSQSLGSGVIVSADGLVITNNHVIENADEVKIALADGREYEAEIKLIDKKSDLAVLQFKPEGELPVVKLGDSESLEVGDLVLAIGNPFGVGQTVTSGIVSALARSQNGVNDFGFFIQTDASINPGNSGGALVAMNGNLIGINTAIYSRSGGSNGIGFAVPSNMVQVVLNSVRLGSSTLMRPWIGAQFQAVTAEIAESVGLDRPQGALVAGVFGGSPAEAAGLQLGDVILAIDGKAVPHVDALGYRLATAGLDRTASLTVLSRSTRSELTLKLAAAPEVPVRDTRLLRGRSPFAGLTVINLSPRTAQELEIPDRVRGVVVSKVDQRSPARRLGFRAGDVLLDINGRDVSSTKVMEDIASRRANGWRFAIEREGKVLRQFLR